MGDFSASMSGGSCRVWVAAALLLAAAAAQIAGGVGDGIIRVKGLQFVDKDCKEFKYIGWNGWELLEAEAGVRASLPGSVAHTGGKSIIEWLLDQAQDNGLKVGRIFAHGHNGRRFVIQTGPGSYNEAGLAALDRIIAQCQNRDLKLILTFADNWKDADSRKSYAAWAGRDPMEFYTDSTIKQWFKDHMAFMVNRVNTVTGIKYRDDPTIFAWNIMNEPRCDCDILKPTVHCQPDCTEKLQNWIAEMADFFKTQDPNHMLTVGEEGFYGPGSGREDVNPDVYPQDLQSFEEAKTELGLTDDELRWARRSGQDFVRNHALDAIDYAAVHSWMDNWGDMPLWFQDKWVSEHANDGFTLGKPVTIEEFGKKVDKDDAATRQSVRDPYFRSMVSHFENSGDQGTLKGIGFWEFDFNNGGDPGEYGVHTDHSAFRDILTPAAQKLAGELEAKNPVGGCVPGELRSFDALDTNLGTYITAGRNLLAVVEGTAVGEGQSGVSTLDCARSCDETPGCGSFEHNGNMGNCILRSGTNADTSVAWSSDGWQTYWKLSGSSTAPSNAPALANTTEIDPVTTLDASLTPNTTIPIASTLTNTTTTTSSELLDESDQTTGTFGFTSTEPILLGDGDGNASDETPPEVQPQSTTAVGSRTDQPDQGVEPASVSIPGAQG